MHKGEGGAVVYLSVARKRLLYSTTNIFHIFALYILAKSLMLCKNVKFKTFLRFKFSIFVVLHLRHILIMGEGVNFFHRTQQKYKIIRAYSNSRMHIANKYREEFRPVEDKKEQTKSLPAT